MAGHSGAKECAFRLFPGCYRETLSNVDPGDACPSSSRCDPPEGLGAVQPASSLPILDSCLKQSS